MKLPPLSTNTAFECWLHSLGPASRINQGLDADILHGFWHFIDKTVNGRIKIKVKVLYNENRFQPQVYISHLFVLCKLTWMFCVWMRQNQLLSKHTFNPTLHSCKQVCRCYKMFYDSTIASKYFLGGRKTQKGERERERRGREREEGEGL